MNDTRRLPVHYAIAAALAGMVAVLYWKVGGYPFMEYDDQLYVTANPVVRQGLTLSGIRWAFTTFSASNWHPLTWISHMADVSLFGMEAGGPHVVNLLFHLANTLLLFHILRRMTGKAWESGLVAALFAIHPLHVESVAWVSERKDVLSTFFWMLSLWAYARYSERAGVMRYLPIPMFMALGLMAKPMLVTLPFVLLLLDYWPLRRFGPSARPSRLLLEKVPLLLLSAFSCVVSLMAQEGAINTLGEAPVWVRVGNALLAYAGYLGKTVWPRGLAVFYPHPAFSVSLPLAGAAALLLVIATVVAVRYARRCPYLPVGWFWFLGTLVPVIGLVQVGGQAMADRYAYVPLVGIFMIAAWGLADLKERWEIPSVLTATAAGGCLAALMACAWFQVGYWSGTDSLFSRALEVTSGNYFAHEALGNKAAREERLDEALTHLLEVVRIKPDSPETFFNIGRILERQGKNDEAIARFREALRLRPGYGEAHSRLGALLAGQGNVDEGMAHIQEALRIRPGDPEANYTMGMILERQGRSDEAKGHYRKAFGPK